MEYQLNQNDKECWLESNQRKRPNYGTKNMLTCCYQDPNFFYPQHVLICRDVSPTIFPKVRISSFNRNNISKKQVAINYKVPSFSRSRLKSTKIPQKKAPFVGRFFPSWQRWPSTSAGHFALLILQGIARCSWDFTGKHGDLLGYFGDLLGTIIWIMISIYPTKILRSHGRMMEITVGFFHGVGI
jgi:hypothetical protein